MSKKNKFLRYVAITMATLLSFSNIAVSPAYAAEAGIMAEEEDDILMEKETEGSLEEDCEGTEPITGTQEETTQVEKETTEVEETRETATEETTETEESTEIETADVEEVSTEEETLETEEATEETPETEEIMDKAAVGELKLVYGDEGLSNEDALVLLLMGDGFTASEQDKFYSEAANTAQYIMECSPYDEFKDVFKIYALGVVSNESGTQGENASSEEAAKADVRDTYFGATFWSYNMQRLVTLSEEGEKKGYELKESYLPEADYNIYLVNSRTYGGSGGDYCIASLNNQSLEMMLHEMGHTIGNLADEYYVPGYEEELANLTQESDPSKIRWSRFIGKNGIGVYDWGGVSGSGWYIPNTGFTKEEQGKFLKLARQFTDGILR